eukprot:366096-Chlamydomonas_euryale.AAC.6
MVVVEGAAGGAGMAAVWAISQWAQSEPPYEATWRRRRCVCVRHFSGQCRCKCGACHTGGAGGRGREGCTSSVWHLSVEGRQVRAGFECGGEAGACGILVWRGGRCVRDLSVEGRQVQAEFSCSLSSAISRRAGCANSFVGVSQTDGRTDRRVDARMGGWTDDGEAVGTSYIYKVGKWAEGGTEFISLKW